MKNIKLSAVVVTYYPELSDAIKNIKQYIDHVDKLIIWENTPVDDRNSYKIILEEYSDKIIYLSTEKNEGIAYALNKSIEWSIFNEYTHILTMDQDGFWTNFRGYRQKIDELSKDKTLGIYAPVTLPTKAIFDDYQVVKGVITSGSVYCLDMFKKTGFFREDYFIDAVDLEFCYRIARKGLKTIVLGEFFLMQQFGSVTEHLFLNSRIQTSNYSSFRLYFIVRNHIFLWKEYPELCKYEKRKILTEYTTLRLIKIILFEKQKVKKTLSIIRGFSHGLLNIGNGLSQKRLQ